MLICVCVCGCSNQHDLGELGGSVEQTPFWKAIASDSCLGVVQIMDKECTPHTRVWCILEVCGLCDGGRV